MSKINIIHNRLDKAVLFVMSFFMFVSAFSQPLPESCKSGLPFDMPEVQLPTFPDKTVNIIDYGAIKDGQTLNTKSFADAIQACAKAGGGKVVVPAGVWLTGPIRLESNINFYLERGALIIFSKNRQDFPLIPWPTPSSKNYSCVPPIYGYKLENVAITGEGIIDGSGEQWRPAKKNKYTSSEWKEMTTSGGVVSPDGSMWWPSQQACKADEYLKSLRKEKKNLTAEDFAPAHDFLRPNMVVLFGCKKVLLDGPTFRNSPKFNVNPVQCEDVVIRNVSIINSWNAQNGDGLDIGSCHKVVIYNCVVDVGDDGICMKPGAVEKEKNWSVACENIVIANCTVYRGHGGFVIGSESYGGVRNISVKNCTFIGTDIGLRFKSSRGRGGLVENVFVDGIQMKDIAHEAILFDMYYEDDKPETGETRSLMPVNDRTPRFQNFFIKNVACNGSEQAISIQGLPEKFAKNIELCDVIISARKSISCIDAENITFKNVKVLSSEGPIFSLDNAKKITIDHFGYPSGTKLFMRVVGKESSEIKILGTDISQAKTGFELGKEVNAQAVLNQ